MTGQDAPGCYDFFILQSSTAAGFALNEFLRAHPDIHMPDREAVDEAFEGLCESRLCQSGGGPECLPGWPNTYRRGFMLHSRVQLEHDVPERVSALCKPGALFFQLVRDPVSVVSASHKRYLQINIFREVASQLGISGYEHEVPIRTPEDVYEWLKPRLFYAAQAARFRGRFASHHLIDATDLGSETVDATLQALYRHIGVNAAFRSELFHKDFHGLLQRMLAFSRMDMTRYGYGIPVRLEILANVEFASDGFTTVLAQTEQVLPVLGGQPRNLHLALVTDNPSWLTLPQKLRAYLLQSRELQAFLEQELLPGWSSLYASVLKLMDEHWVRELPAPLIGRMRDELAGDYAALFRVRPELEALWGWDVQGGGGLRLAGAG